MNMNCCGSNSRKSKIRCYQSNSNYNNNHTNNENDDKQDKSYIDNTSKSYYQKIDKFSKTPENIDNSNYGTIGLINLGYLCYFNAAIQNLKNAFPFTLYILKNHKKFSKSDFIYKYCKLIANLIEQDEYKFCEPKEFFCHFHKLSPNFRIGEQNDSNICIIYILNKFEKEARKEGIPNPDIIDSLSKDEKEKFKDFIYKSYSQRNSYILDIFFGFQEDIFECRNAKCNEKNYFFQGFTVLNIPIVTSRNYNIPTLEEAIKLYQYKRLHKDKQGFICQKCNGRDIQSLTKIISYPKILIINFKRIGEKYFYNHNVEVPSVLNLDKYQYELIGFIKHIGGAKSGHNMAICKNFFDNKWYEYDDFKVNEIKSLFKIKDYYLPDTKNGFLFFYKKLGIFDNIETQQDKNFIIQASSELRK